MLSHPHAGEYAPFYQRYVDLVPDGDFATVMTSPHPALLGRLRAAASRSAHRYAEGKWTLAEVVQHLCDTERVFAYRLLCFARGQVEPLPGFDENAWGPASQANGRDYGGLVDEFALVRRSTVSLVAGLPASVWTNGGVMSGGPATARAMPYLMAGHERHHDAILRERYGV